MEAGNANRGDIRMSEQSMLFPVSVGRPTAAPDEMVHRELHIRITVLPLTAGRVARVAVVLDGHEAPQYVIIATGYMHEPELEALASGTRLEVTSWMAVRHAMERLLAADAA
jgi:hypothetical protein